MIDPSVLPNIEKTDPEDALSDGEDVTMEDIVLILKLIFNNFYVIQLIMWTIFILTNLDLFLYLAIKGVGSMIKFAVSVFEILIFINDNL